MQGNSLRITAHLVVAMCPNNWYHSQIRTCSRPRTPPTFSNQLFQLGKVVRVVGGTRSLSRWCSRRSPICWARAAKIFKLGQPRIRSHLI